MALIDIICPGVMLSYLRLYDLNRGSMYFGVYTLCGNITVVIATIVWVAIEYGYPFSVPFSLVTYISLMFVTFSFHGPPMSGKICGLECSRSKLLLWIQVS